MKYRSVQLYGAGYTCADQVIAYEVFELKHYNILDTLSDSFLKQTEIGERLKKFSQVLNQTIQDKEIANCISKYQKDQYEGSVFIDKVLEEIKNVTGKKINYCLWLCDSIDDIKEVYGKEGYKIRDINPEVDEFGEYSDFDAYEESDIILSDLGKAGKLYGYEEAPRIIKSFDEEDLLEKERNE